MINSYADSKSKVSFSAGLDILKREKIRRIQQYAGKSRLVGSSGDLVTEEAHLSVEVERYLAAPHLSQDNGGPRAPTMGFRQTP